MKVFSSVFAVCLACISVHGLAARNDADNGRPVGLKGINLVKPASSILHEKISVISVEDDDSGSVAFKHWKPSREELQSAEDLHIDAENLAVVRQRQQEGGRRVFAGVVNGKKLNENGDFQEPAPTGPFIETHADFIGTPKNLTQINSKKSKAGVIPPLIVETLIVVDKDFADLFQQDRVKILDYLTVFFWDINLRYKTLPSVDISFRIIGVVIISTPNGQPFIEQARDEKGEAELGRILWLFNFWIFDNPSNFPKFDIAVAITNTNLEWGGGVAYMGSNCWNRGVVVWNDWGAWQTITIAAHEIAHTLGAGHDDPEQCLVDGYIMSGGHHKRWFFSECSDKWIADYVSTDWAACLRRIDEPGHNPISSDFSAIKPPTMDEQCKKFFGPTAFIEEADKSNCEYTRCLVPNQGGYWTHWFETVDNTLCTGGGRCFRGKCRKPDFRVQNVASGQCLKPPNPFAWTVQIEMADCPQPGTPYDRFSVNDTSYGKTLSTTWQTVDAEQHGDRCTYTGNAEGGRLWTDVCGENPWHGWDFIDLWNNEFMLRHRITGRCAKQVGSGIQTFQNCDLNDSNMRWKLI